MRTHSLFAGMALAALLLPICAVAQSDREAYFERFTEFMPASAEFDAWQERTGELPPDFSALPRINGLPDPLQFLDGREVRSIDDWNQRRAEILELEELYDLGSFPPKPELTNVEVLSEEAADGQVTRDLRLEFGSDPAASLRATVTLPAGDGPFPVMISPNLAGPARGFGATALERGYIAAGFAGNDRENDANAYVELFPEHDFADLPRRAWSAQLLVDYLHTLPEVDTASIAINGYSRDGKMALIAAAIDERIAAVIPSSTGVGGVMPWRLGSERGFGESIESTTRNFPTWFVPRLRFFSGREDRLPVDGNLLVALVAPRSVLISYGNNDEVSQPWPMEQAYLSALRAWEFLGEPEALGILHSPGYHGANDVDAAMDWLDIQFGRSDAAWDNDLIYPWNYEQWHSQAGEAIDLSEFPVRTGSDALLAADGTPIESVVAWERYAASMREAVEWMLGDAESGALANPFPLPELGDPAEPAFAGRGRGGNAAASVSLFDDIHDNKATSTSYGWVNSVVERTSKRKLSFPSPSGFRDIEAHLYTPADADADQRLPAVIWLHGMSTSLGYSWVYHYEPHPALALADAGYAVLAFDQSGFGSRQTEAAGFYNRYPHWSRMGQLVADTQAAVDLLMQDEQVDPDRIYLFGYSMGAQVALHTAALDPRIGGVVSLNGFTPMRTDTADTGTGGIARYFRDFDLLPRLGAFESNEARLPYDYDELIAAIAPRPVYVLAAQLDRDATHTEVQAAIERAAGVYSLYGEADKLRFDEPWDYNRLPLDAQQRAIDWMQAMMP